MKEGYDYIDNRRKLILKDFELAAGWQIHHARHRLYVRLVNISLLVCYAIVLQVFGELNTKVAMIVVLLTNMAFMIIEVLQWRYESFESDIQKEILDLFSIEDPDGLNTEIMRYEFRGVRLEGESIGQKFNVLMSSFVSYQILLWYAFIYIAVFITVIII